MTPELRLSHLAIYRSGSPLYSERYHGGVNIIHGDNGSGKSTVMDFIFFALGGDLREWKHHAQMADYVLVEVLAGTATLTLRRDVSEKQSRPMQIYFGPISEAVNAGPASWRTCPYQRQQDSYSFSQILFKAIGLPEAISDGSSNITMHQVLRLIYGDQLTPIQRLFRVEHFDTWQTRQAVGDLMCGIGGYELYERQIALRATSQKHDEVSRVLRNLIQVAAGYGDNVLAEHIAVAMQKAVRERDGLQGRLSEVLVSEQVEEADDNDAKKLEKSQARAVARARRTVAELEDRIATLEYEIEDASLFVSHLQRTLADFDDASMTFMSLGQVRFEFCPSCFKPIAENTDQSHCHLCGNPNIAASSDPKNLAVRLDIEMQLRESHSLQEEREEALVKLKSKMRAALFALKSSSEAFELSRRGLATDREKLVADLGRKIGFLESEIKVLQSRQALAAEIEQLSSEKDKLNSQITRLKNEIDAIVSSQDKRKRIAYTLVSDTAKQILDQDLKEHSDFGEVDFVSFSFADDWVAINDEKNRSRSASGMVVLKNSFLLALFISSLRDKLFGLPRFMLLDNIEDKGMVEERSWNFQEVLVRECESYQDPHQIIFSTSKISPKLNNPNYVVGRKYTQEHPSLDFTKSSAAPNSPDI